jgi:hypothetical protein
VPLADAYAALVKDRPHLHAFAARFAGLPVRNAGTLGGNVVNGSPIGDSMPRHRFFRRWRTTGCWPLTPAPRSPCPACTT